jgi:predicted nucleic acid-binding protein
VTRSRYFDSSAIVKLIVDEPESPALRSYVRTSETTTTSIVGVIEARRAAARRGTVASADLTFALGGFEVIELDSAVADDSARIGPPSLRPLDAIHLASARQLGRDLEAIVTYDRRMADAAREAGLPVSSPGTEPGSADR